MTCWQTKTLISKAPIKNCRSSARTKINGWKYEAREKAIRDYNEGLSEAEEYGIAFRKNTVARIKKPVALLCCNFDTTSACYEIFSANCH